MAVPGRVRTEQGGMTIGPMREKQVQMEAAERTRCGGFLLAHKPTSASYRISLKCPLMKMSTKKNLNFHLFSFTSETITFFFSPSSSAIFFFSLFFYCQFFYFLSSFSSRSFLHFHALPPLLSPSLSLLLSPPTFFSSG